MLLQQTMNIRPGISEPCRVLSTYLLMLLVTLLVGGCQSPPPQATPSQIWMAGVATHTSLSPATTLSPSPPSPSPIEAQPIQSPSSTPTVFPQYLAADAARKVFPVEGVRGELAVNLSTLSLISLGGGSPRSLGFHLPTFSSFRWSPDGQRIAYVVWNDLWVMDVETGKSDNLTKTPNRMELDPRWSPDGKWIAFLSSRGLEPGEATETVIKVPVDRLYVIDLTTGRFQEVSVQPIRAFSWSPDSRRMAYGDEQGHLFTFDLLHGKGKRQPLVLTEYGLSSDLSACSATWSPQGDTIAIFFSSRPAPEEKSARKGYALLDLVNHTARILHDYTMTETMAYGGFPSGEHVGGCDQGPALWSPSGEWLLLTILPVPRTNLDGSFWLADSQGKQKRRLGSTYGAYAADWSPDGKWIAYIDLGDRSLRLASLTNSDREYVVMGERCCDGLAWRPDGSNR